MCVYECMFGYVKRQRQTEMRGDIWGHACHGACVEMKGQWVTALWHPFLLLSFTWLWGTKLRSSGFCFRCLNLLSRLAGSEKSIWNHSTGCYSAAHHTWKLPSMWAAQPFPRSGSSFYVEEADLSQTRLNCKCRARSSRKVIALCQALDPVINLMLKCKSQLPFLGNDEFRSAIHISELSVGSDQTDTGAASAITWLLVLFPIQMCWPRNQVSMGTLP